MLKSFNINHMQLKFRCSYKRYVSPTEMYNCLHVFKFLLCSTIKNSKYPSKPNKTTASKITSCYASWFKNLPAIQWHILCNWFSKDMKRKCANTVGSCAIVYRGRCPFHTRPRSGNRATLMGLSRRDRRVLLDRRTFRMLNGRICIVLRRSIGLKRISPSF